MAIVRSPVFCGSCSTLVSAEPYAERASVCPVCGARLDITDDRDVFISYATADIATAQTIASGLGGAGVSHWLAPERIETGDDFLAAIAPALERARVVVLVLSASAVQSAWVRREVTDAVSRHCPVLPLKIEEFELPREWRILLTHNQWDDAFREPFAVRIDRVVARAQQELRRIAAAAVRTLPPIATSPLTPPVLEGVNPDQSPYAGPRPFTARMADRFFGRESEAKTLLDLMAASRVVLVHAPSGAGKSSLLNTLVAQSLEGEGFDVLTGARVGGALPDTVKAADIRNIYSFSAICGLDSAVVPSPRSRLADHLRAMPRKPATRGRVLIFDQFEELFTQHVERFEDREGFFDDLIAALEQDPSLRVILAMRQEFLADLDPLTARLPSPLEVRRVALRRLQPAQALESITRPAARYTTFEPGVAEAIVRQLNTIKVRGFDGVLVEKQGEFIEMVHLQIVCERLWTSLPRGITRITSEHVNRAAGEGKTFDEFVVNALDAFYDDTIERIANSASTREHGGYSTELLRLGCMKFVTTSATRTMVQETHGRTGRLPDWIIDQLESSHLLRSEIRGGERWYELAHDRLAEPVGRRMDRKVNTLLYAADLLDRVLEKARAENGGGLQGYFAEHRDVVLECQPFHGQSGLFADEVEFIFRASLASGVEVREWSRRARDDFPAIHKTVIHDALAAPSPVVRRHAVALLGLEPAGALSSRLIELALADEDPAVRSAAATSLVELDSQALYAGVSDRLTDPATRTSALLALSRMRAVADQRVRAPLFDAHVSQLPRQARTNVSRLTRALRFRQALPVLPFIVLPTALLAAVAAAAFKWLPGTLDFAIVQATPSAGMGIFHGITAGIIWAGTIVFGVTLYYLVYAREFAPRSAIRPAGAIAAGAASGLVSSALVVLCVLSVYTVDALAGMGWIVGEPRRARFALDFWRDLFVDTRFGWAHIITGTGLGIGMALTTNALRASPRWAEFLARQTSLVGLAQTKAVLREIARIAAPFAWRIPALVGAAAVIAFLVVHAPSTANPHKQGAFYIAMGLAGDCLTQVIGAYFGIVGMGLGTVMVRCGFRFDPRTT